MLPTSTIANSGTMFLRRNNGNGTFGSLIDLKVSTEGPVTLVDFDGDGDLDLLAVSDDDAENVRVILNITPMCCRADWNDDGIVNSTDVGEFINSWFEDQLVCPN